MIPNLQWLPTTYEQKNQSISGWQTKLSVIWPLSTLLESLL